MKPTPEKVRITVNGKTIEAPKGQVLLTACMDNGIYIPHYCYHTGIGISGNCRMCLVELKGARGPAPSCATFCSEGLEAQTETPKIQALRAQVLEFYLGNHPLDCPFCDKGGECPLQNYTMIYHKGGSRFTVPKNHHPKHVRLGEHIVFDSERCILCTRCVRYYREVLGDEQLGVRYRGSHSEISTFGDVPLAHGLSGNIADFCPVGALTTVEYRFKARPWELQQRPTRCAGCSNGCPTTAWRLNNKTEILRLTAHQDEATGTYWICDEGRFAPNRLAAAGRLLKPTDRARNERGWAQAIEAAGASLRAGDRRVVVSPQWTRRELQEAQESFGKEALVSTLPAQSLGFLAAVLEKGWLDNGLPLLAESDLMIEQVAQPLSFVGSVLRLRLRAAQRERRRPWLATTDAPYHREMGVTVDAKLDPEGFLRQHAAAKDVLVVVDQANFTPATLNRLQALAALVAERGGRFGVCTPTQEANALDQARLGIASYENANFNGATLIGLVDETPKAVLDKVAKSGGQPRIALALAQPAAQPAFSADWWLPTPASWEKSGSFTSASGEKAALQKGAESPAEVLSIEELFQLMTQDRHGIRIPIQDGRYSRPATA